MEGLSDDGSTPANGVKIAPFPPAPRVGTDTTEPVRVFALAADACQVPPSPAASGGGTVPLCQDAHVRNINTPHSCKV